MSAVTDTTPADDFVIQAMLKSWASFPQADRIKFYRESAAAYQDPQKRKQAEDILGEVGDKAIKTDKSFRNIRDKFKQFAAAHRDRFPELEKEYVPEWDKLYQDWVVAFKKSQDYAAVTATEYKDRYIAVILELVSRADLKDPESVRKEQARLKRYSKEAQPKVIPVDYENAFKKLRTNVILFQAKFEAYLAKMKEKITEEIRRLNAELATLVKRLNELNEAVDNWTIALAATSWTGIIGTVITGVGLALKIRERNAKAREVVQKKAEIERANAAQNGLRQIVTEFGTLGGEFDSIKGNLHSLTQIWRDMHVGSIKFSHLLERAVNGGDDAEEFKLSLLAAKSAADPVHKSLSEYARKIEGYFLASDEIGQDEKEA